MVTISEIPLSPIPQQFNITLGGITYQFRLYWIGMGAQCWQFDMADSDGNLLIAGVPILPSADLFAQHKWLGFPGQLRVAADYDPNAPPTLTDLGISSHLYYVQP